MSESYPRRDQARGIWKINDITKNIKDEGTYPQLGGGTVGLTTLGNGTSDKTINKVNIETTGNATDFGDLGVGRNQNSALGTFTRIVFAGGDTGSVTNSIEYVDPLSTGNAADFGDLTVAKRLAGGTNNNTRGVFAGGKAGSNLNDISFITVASLGNASDFGDLSGTRAGISGGS